MCGISSKAQTLPSMLRVDWPSDNIFWNGKQSFERSHRWSVESVWEHDKSTVPISKTTG